MALVLKKSKPAAVIDITAKFPNAKADTDAALDEAAQRIRAEISTMHDAGAAIGRELIAVKEKVPHGQWGNWLTAEFDMSERTAQNYMRVAKLCDEVGADIVAVLPVAAQYALAAPSTPQGVKDAIVGDIKAGAKVTTESVKAQIAGAKPGLLPKTMAKAKAIAGAEQQAATEAVAMLVKHLGTDYATFIKLYRKAGPDFGNALMKAVAHAG